MAPLLQPTDLPRCPIAVFTSGVDVTELHVGPTGRGLLVAESPRGAVSARASQAGPVAVNPVITCSVSAGAF